MFMFKLNHHKKQVMVAQSRWKKQKRQETTVDTLHFKKNDWLTALPLELLAEILVETRSPKDVLSIARSCKYFYNVLSSPSGSFIWKRVRRSCVPRPMPSPPEHLTEFGYASFVFDGGECELCGSFTNEMYISFSLRMRVCSKKGRCYPQSNIQTLVKKFSFLFIRKNTRGSELVMRMEDNAFGMFRHILPDLAVSNVRTYRFMQGSLKDEISRYRYWMPIERASPERCQEPECYGGSHTLCTTHGRAVLSLRTRKWLRFCNKICAWRVDHQRVKERVERYNDSLAAKFVKEHGYNLNDLMNHTSYGTVHRQRTKQLEQVTSADHSIVLPMLEPELIALAENRKRKEYEISHNRIRTALQKHYHHLRSRYPNVTTTSYEVPKPVVPPFSTFLSLPIVKTLLDEASYKTSGSIGKTLKNGLVDVINAELADWADEARRGLAAVLGVLDWKSIDFRTPHPVYWHSARFQCGRCHQVTGRCEADACLDFAGACAHQCPGSDDVWEASKFVRDEKAIAAVRTYLSLFDINEAHDDALDEIRDISNVKVQCLSCKPYCVMTVNQIIGHCHRHENMQLRRLEVRANQLLEHFPLSTDLLKKYIGRSRKEKTQLEQKDYGCRLCLYKEAAKCASPEPQQLVEKLRKMSLDGVGMHVAACHGYRPLRNEDIFRFSKLS
ncbi:hypothetical protein AMATHDRAFT_6189 [Amanita thiersii Skay4041]|uniref:F-box domain-containing protein n=1 Tax=Amanita thiersii Skay4041 TaxID=703135 RepID=A0A2A9NK10_9AGAR|nr:hypothetical protein AMATHDRAFT_6189 [Amanita thiersii Skay4041]